MWRVEVKQTTGKQTLWNKNIKKKRNATEKDYIAQTKSAVTKNKENNTTQQMKCKDSRAEKMWKRRSKFINGTHEHGKKHCTVNDINAKE